MKLSSARIKGVVFVLIILCVFAGLMTLGSFYDVIISETLYKFWAIYLVMAAALAYIAKIFWGRIRYY